ncbi:hypothetical protein [Deinococcus sp. Marseille-Q6407]|uniref:hypothetical protein n=1 Tax=Deinococcus sp. Marseille-Q6407 TaxID=2969223 RepID=UPI0021BF1574|nr:hypothetical protein [Deinococcus sp. Marseille-Q6407]
MISPARRRVWCLAHCQQRAAERYGLHLSARDYDALCAHLAEYPPRPYAFDSGGGPIYLVRVLGKDCKLAFDPDAQLVRTFLPPYAYERHLLDPHAIHRDRKRDKARRNSGCPGYGR